MSAYKFTVRIVLSIAAAVSALLLVAAMAASAQAAAGPQTRHVCAASVYVKKQPYVVMVGTAYKGWTVKVTRYTKSGRYAQIATQIATRRPQGFTVRGWVPTSSLCAPGHSAESVMTSRYPDIPSRASE